MYWDGTRAFAFPLILLDEETGLMVLPRRLQLRLHVAFQSPQTPATLSLTPFALSTDPFSLSTRPFEVSIDPFSVSTGPSSRNLRSVRAFRSTVLGFSRCVLGFPRSVRGFRHSVFVSPSLRSSFSERRVNPFPSSGSTARSERRPRGGDRETSPGRR